MLVHGRPKHWSMTARDTFYKSNSESWYTTPHHLDIWQHKYNQFLQKNLLIDIHYLPSLFVTVWSCCCRLLTVGRQCTPASTKWHPTANPLFTTRRRAHIYCRPWTSNSYFFYCISIPLHQETSLGPRSQWHLKHRPNQPTHLTICWRLVVSLPRQTPSQWISNLKIMMLSSPMLIVTIWR
jgi:hypothetical protein